MKHEKYHYATHIVRTSIILTSLTVLLVSLPVFLYYLGKTQYQKNIAVSCDDRNCENFDNNGFPEITNCDTNDGNGDQQLCNRAGRIGLCGGQKFCCPAFRAQWTRDMTACPEPSETPLPITNTQALIPTNAFMPTTPPSNTPTVRPSSTPTLRPMSTPSNTQTVRPSNTPPKTPTIIPTNTSVPTATIIPTPTPTKSQCNDTCYYSRDCIDELNCYIVSNAYVCRKASCINDATCTCAAPTPTGTLAADITTTPTDSSPTAMSDSGIFITPIAMPTPTPNPLAKIPELTIDKFTDSKNETPATFTLTGSTDPSADIDISVGTSGPTYTTTADADGKWRFIVTKPLASGNKDLIVTARNSGGGVNVIKQSFKVKGTSPLRPILISLIVIIVGVIGYLVYRKQMEDQIPFPPQEVEPKPPDAPSTPSP